MLVNTSSYGYSRKLHNQSASKVDGTDDWCYGKHSLVHNRRILWELVVTDAGGSGILGDKITLCW